MFINGHEEDLIEAAAGLLDNLDPESRIKAEAEEETGFKVTRVENFEAYMSGLGYRETLLLSGGISSAGSDQRGRRR